MHEDGVAQGALHKGGVIGVRVTWKLCTRALCCTRSLARGLCDLGGGSRGCMEALHEDRMLHKRPCTRGHARGPRDWGGLCTRVRLSTRRPRCTRGVARGGRLPLHNGHRTEALHGRFARGLCTRAARCTTARHCTAGRCTGGHPMGRCTRTLHEGRCFAQHWGAALRHFARGPFARGHFEQGPLHEDALHMDHFHRDFARGHLALRPFAG